MPRLNMRNESEHHSGDYLSTIDVAEHLHISPRTVRLWAECGEIPAVKIGRLWRFDYRLFTEWLLTRSTGQMTEIR